MAVNFDTHATVKELTLAGFSEAQAEALVKAVAGQRHDLATKPDIAALHDATQTDLQATSAELRNEMAELRSEMAALGARLTAVETELRLHRWVLGLLVGLQLASLGLLFTLLRLI